MPVRVQTLSGMTWVHWDSWDLVSCCSIIVSKSYVIILSWDCRTNLNQQQYMHTHTCPYEQYIDTHSYPYRQYIHTDTHTSGHMNNTYIHTDFYTNNIYIQTHAILSWDCTTNLNQQDMGKLVRLSVMLLVFPVQDGVYRSFLRL